MKAITKYITIPAAALTVAVFGVGVVFDASEDSRAKASWEDGARGACRVFIERAAGPEANLQWVGFSEWGQHRRQDGTIVVRAEYSAENAYGARVGEAGVCEMQFEDGQYVLSDFRQ